VPSYISRRVIDPTAHSLSTPLAAPENPTPNADLTLLTPRARTLSAQLLAHGINARPISWPTVPKGTDRVRVCLHSGNTHIELDMLIDAAIAWAAAVAREEGDSQYRERYMRMGALWARMGTFLQSKL
jgi:8-amino-7-oxononanoate synthase